MSSLASTRLLFLFAAPLLFSGPAPAPASAQSLTDWSARFRMVFDERQLTETAWVTDFAGDFAYFARPGRLEIWDLSNPIQPVPRGDVEIGAHGAICLTVSGGLAVVGPSGGAGVSFTILDISDPDHPAVLGGGESAHPILDVEIIGDHLYVSRNWVGIDVWDITDPTAPVLTDTPLPGVFGRSLDALGTMLYVMGVRRITAIDCSAPAAPVTHSSVDHPDPRDLFEFLAIAVGDSPTRVVATSFYDRTGNYDEVRISSFDLAPPNTGTETAFVTECPGVPKHVAVREGVAFVAFSTSHSQNSSGNTGIQVVDFSGPGAAETIAAAGVKTGEPRGVAVVGDDVILVEAGGQWHTALQVFDARPPDGVPSTGSIEGRAVALVATADRLFAAFQDELRIHDSSTPGLPLLGSVPLSYPLLGRALAGENNVVLTGAHDSSLGGRLETYDVSDPGSPHLIGSVGVGGYPIAITVQDGIAYASTVAEEWGEYGELIIVEKGLFAVDFTSPSAPVPLGGLDLEGSLRPGVVLSGSRLYAARYGELETYDISVPGTFTLVNEVMLSSEQRSSVNCLAVRGDALFGAFYSHPAASADGFATACVAFSLSDPDRPAEVGHVGLPGETIDGLVVDGDMVYVANGVAGVIAIDAADPQHLSIVGHFAAGRSAKELALGDGALFVGNEVAWGNTGPTRVWRVPPHALLPTEGPVVGHASSLRVRPNPARGTASLGFSLPASGPVRLEIVDVRGRLVRLITDDWSDAGPREFVWDGRNQAHRTTAAGVYFVRLVDGNRVETRKLTRLR